MIRTSMDNTTSFLDRCELTGGREPKEILADVLQLLSEEDRWAWGCLARRTGGRPCKPSHPEVQWFSIAGALAHCSNQVGVVPPSLLRLMDQMVIDFLELGTEVGIWEDRDVGWFNDTFDHKSVVDLLEYTCWRLANGTESL